MGMKQFFAPNLKAVILAILVFVVVPLPFFFVIGGAFAPAWAILGYALTFIKDGDTIAGLLGIPVFLLYILLAYAGGCIGAHVLGKMTHRKSVQWLGIGLVSVLLVIGSFFRIYIEVSIGGEQWFNLTELRERHFPNRFGTSWISPNTQPWHAPEFVNR